MSRTILLFCCGLLALSNDATAANLAALEKPVTQPASRAQAVKPLVIPARKAPASATAHTSKVVAKPAAKSVHAAQSSASAKTVKAVKTPPVKAKPSRSNAAGTRLAPIKLNLNLPPELVENMEFGKPLAEVDELPVLPPMFGASKPAPSAYQLSGKLISNERQKETSDNYLDSVEGAELSIEFRH
jgi:hypothetical protein